MGGGGGQLPGHAPRHANSAHSATGTAADAEFAETSLADAVVTADEAEEDGPFELGGVLKGAVVDPHGEPVAGGRVVVVSPVLDPASTPGTAVTDQRGEFLLEQLPLPPVDIQLAASASGWTAKPAVSQLRQDSRSVPWVTLRLTRAGPLLAAVTDTAGQPIAAAKVATRPVSATRVYATALTDEDGIAAFDDAPIGDGVVTAEKTGYSPPGFGASAENAKRVTVGADGVAEVILRLERAVALRGVVLAPEGTPVPDAGVFSRVSSLSGFRSSGHASPSARTAADGRFTLEELPEGRVQLCAVLTGRGVSEWLMSQTLLAGLWVRWCWRCFPPFRWRGSW